MMKDIIPINTITEVHHALGLEKPKHPLVSVFDATDMCKATPLQMVKAKSNLFQVWFKDGVEGSIGYGRNSYDFTEGSLVFIKPGQVLQPESKTINERSKAWILMFHPDLIRRSELGKSIDTYSFFSYDVHEALHVSDEEKKMLTEIAEKIKKEYNQNIDKHSQKLIISNIELLLDYCLRYYDRQFYTRTNFNKDIVSKFERHLTEYYEKEQQLNTGIPSVKLISNELSTSANYLSDLLKKETGSSAQEIIHTFVINRAKNGLLGSNESISQIAYDLGFEYPQHFSKLFKKKTGMTPVKYRNKN